MEISMDLEQFENVIKATIDFEDRPTKARARQLLRDYRAATGAPKEACANRLAEIWSDIPEKFL